MDEKSYPTVMIGSDPDRMGEENYFYYEPGSDASIIFQVAIDYLHSLEDVEDS